MHILAHGIDIVSVPRIAEMIERHGDRFLRRCFTEAERAYAMNSRRAPEHFGARFAAKEATMKALGTGWAHGLAWTDIEVARLPTGQPALALSGVAADEAQRLGITRWLISLSHTDDYAAASVIALADTP